MRINALTLPTGLFGYAYDALRQAVYGRHSARISDYAIGQLIS